MDQKTFQKLILLNTDFYKSLDTDFLDTRKYPWRGWLPLMVFLKSHFIKYKEISVLDLGCGNGRFYEFLLNNIKNKKIQYTGIDNNENYIYYCRSKFPGAKFCKRNIVKNPGFINYEYDLIVGFGFSHHIPSEEFRYKWFSSILTNVKNNGVVVFTFWNFLKEISNHDLKIDSNNILLEKNDYLIGWGKTKLLRYYHYYDDEEISNIKSIYKNNGCKLEKTYISDNSERKLSSNTYYIWTCKNK